MGVRLRLVLVLVAVGCSTVLLHSFSHMHNMLAAPTASRYPAEFNVAALRLLQDFPSQVRALERRLVSLETAIAEASQGVAALQTTLGPEPSQGQQAGGSDGSSQVALRWRQDGKCGKDLPEARVVACNPSGEDPCCSPTGWCGHSDEHCKCSDCVDYRSPPSGQQNQEKGKTVLVVIPFRDRERHLVNFKKYWQWFSREGVKPRKVTRWEIFVVEQFDSEAFNRGWNFNVGVAIASAQTAASPEITTDMRLDFDCAAIQDIDYLPEEGVDYSQCDVPIQLSSEIDRYDWKTPYIQSAGGIVSMSLQHWRTINGFGNDYFGWGGEDDELFHRLRLNGLLYGDCYPFCAKNDKNKGRPGKSIKRPPKGFGRFSGKYMHSANHTKRITDSGAYDRNVQMLDEIKRGGSRWKTDGLSSLEFRIVGQETDRTDTSEYGITYHHVRVRRGKAPFPLSRLPLGVPASMCLGEPSAEGWEVNDLSAGSAGLPWDLPALRARLAALAAPGGTCAGASQASFLLLDRRRHFAKILASDNPEMLLVFYRSLPDPPADGLIIAEPRATAALRQAFVAAGAFLAPAVDHNLCSAKVKDGLKYSIHQGGPVCSGGSGWSTVSGAFFRAFTKPRSGLQAVSFCDNSKYWTQHIVDAEQCPETWAGLQWKHGGTFWVPRGRSYCIGTRLSEKESLSFSRMLRQERCDGDGFVHAFGFKSVMESTPALTVCVGHSQSGLHLAEGPGCQADGRLARFAARTATSAAKTDRLFCVESGSSGDELSEAHECGPQQKFVFAVPRDLQVQEGLPAEARRLPVCISPTAGAQQATVGFDCKAGVLRFEAPSLLDLLMSTPGTGSAAAPLYTLVEEDSPCFTFLCQGLLLR